MKFHIVTTMTAKAWEEFGRRMVESVIALWPVEALPITLYAEDFDPEPMAGLEVRRLPAWLDEFKQRWGKAPAYTGHRNGGYDYRFDAIKFAHKVAALTDFGLDLFDGVMIWLDADTVTHAAVTPEWLTGLFPEPAYLAWLDRANSHPECGFVMFRASNDYHHNFMEAFRNLYTSGDIFKLRETHDSFVLQWLVYDKVTKGKIRQPVSLSGDKRWHHPFVSGPLGACLDHFKGPSRKAARRSRPQDLRHPRPELYWRGAV